MKISRRVMTAVLVAAFAIAGRGVENPSSTNLAPILQQVQERAKLEADNDRAFDQRYSYSREKITEYRNSAGDVKKREDKTNTHQPSPPTAAAPIPAAQTNVIPQSVAPQQDQAVSDTHTNVRGKQFKKNDFLLDKDLLNRFQLKLAGQEIVNGRPAWMLDFVPADKTLPERNLKDRFINKAAGRIWVDAADYSLVKADMHLTKQVNVALGIAGAVWKFTYSFERQRTEEGLWFTRKVDWHLEGREVVVHRTVDYHEETKDLQKVNFSTAH